MMANPQFAKAIHHAQEVVCGLSAAYWDDARKAHHEQALLASMATLAERLGGAFVPADPATARAVIQQIAPGLGLRVYEAEPADEAA